MSQSIKLNSSLRIARLFLSSWILILRSKKGFISLISIIRLVGCIGIGISFFFAEGAFDSNLFKISWFFYFTLAILALLIAIHRNAILEKPYVRFGLICIDLLAVTLFLLLRHDIHSELYLLLILPLVVSAHFLPRLTAILFTAFVITVYGYALFTIRNQHAYIEIIYLWLLRSLFLFVSTWLYRIQRNIPPSTAFKALTPTHARERLERQLEQLGQIVAYDTTSLQLLYRDRLLIIACVGFQNKRSIYNIEFPTDNPNYPNYYVLQMKKPIIEDATKYPSFRDHIYKATHIKTWMGIPLISPTTDEIIGILSVDSAREHAYSNKDALNATRVAMQISAFLMEVALGPAALTMLTMRESIQTSIKVWSDELSQRAVTCKDDLEAAAQIVKICNKIFRTEDCSLFFQRPKYHSDKSDLQSVLHLVASSSVPASQFKKHESKVSDQLACGLTGYSVYKNTTLNYNSREIQESPYHGSFTENLEYLVSGHSKQVMIVPIRNYTGDPIGALKIENKIGWPSDNRFTPYEQYLFESFAHTIGMIIEGIRHRNFINRQRRNFHHLRGMISGAILKPLDSLVSKAGSHDTFAKEYAWIGHGVDYVASEIDNLLLDPGEFLTLEREGLIPALLAFVSLLSSGFPHFSEAASRVVYLPSEMRDDLPYLVKETFFDIGREALLNAIRHSKVEEIDNGRIGLCFEKENGSYVLSIEDNGVGFQWGTIGKAKPTYGITDMKMEIKNIERIGKYADLIIDTKADKGTTVKVTWTP